MKIPGPRWQLPAAVAWASFLGAIPILLAWLALPPGDERLDGALLTAMFFAAWLCAALPAAITATLAHAPRGDDGR